MAVLANRISYFFDLHGPSIQVDTACSSSLIAVHQAVEALRHGAGSLALVGGINIMCHPGNTIAYYKAGMLSKTGRCRTFDQAADGYVRSEGAAVLVLKPLRQAVRDHDPVQAVLRGTACNHGGAAAGLTVPNPSQQSELLKEAWSAAGIDPSSIGYIEMHGTGTKLGDPVEIRGLTQAMAYPTREASSSLCGLSSIKTNLGHLEAAAGIAGLLKVVLSLRHAELPRTVHFQTLNPQIDLEGTPFYIVRRHEHWPKPAASPRRAAVSSFGSGGTNAHVVLEEFAQVPAQAARDLASPTRFLFVLSAKERERLVAYAKRLLEFTRESRAHGPVALESLVYGLQRRQALEERIAFVVRSLEELEDHLLAFTQGVASPVIHLGNADRDRTISDFVAQHDDFRGVVRTWAQTRQLERLAKLWTKSLVYAGTWR